MKKAYSITKIEKFLLAENEMMRNDPRRGEYILHTRHPAMLIQIHNTTDPLTSSVTLSSDDIGNLRIEYVNTDGIIEEIFLRIIFLYEDSPKEKIINVLKRAADWYLNYLQWQDDAIDEEESQFN